MKSLLNITVFASAVLSIFSTSLTLYEVPELKEALSAMERKDRIEHETRPEKNMKRIYISHDVSDTTTKNSESLLGTKHSSKDSIFAEDYIKVFGVKISSSNRSNI